MQQEANSNWQLAVSQSEKPNKPKEMTEEEQIREAERISPEISEYKREMYVLAKDGRLVHRIEIESQVENRIRRKLGMPSSIAPQREILEWHRRQLGLLQKADAAPRCEHVFIDGTTCQSPRMKKHQYCYAHARMLEVRPKKLKLLPAEDENSIMWNIMEIQRALIDDEITEKKAGLLLYGQQLQLIAVRGVTFKQTEPDGMVRVMPKIHHGDNHPIAPKPGASGAPDTETRRNPELAADERRGTQKEESPGSPTGQDIADIGENEHQEPQRAGNRGIGGSGDRVIGNAETMPGDELDKSLFSGDERRGPGGVQSETIPSRRRPA
jgi:hypothetical protein